MGQDRSSRSSRSSEDETRRDETKMRTPCGYAGSMEAGHCLERSRSRVPRRVTWAGLGRGEFLSLPRASGEPRASGRRWRRRRSGERREESERPAAPREMHASEARAIESASRRNRRLGMSSCWLDESGGAECSFSPSFSFMRSLRSVRERARCARKRLRGGREARGGRSGEQRLRVL